MNAVSRQPPKRICVVEDDESVRESLRLLLETYGLTVRAYASGTEFFADHGPFEADCMIVDQHLPFLDGLDLIARLRAEGRMSPAILITGRCDGAIRRRAREVGVLSILEKPFGSAPLMQLVTAAVEEAPAPGGRRERC